MNEIIDNLQFLAAVSVAIEIGFETLFSVPWVEAFFKQKKARVYLKRVAVFSFCLVLCSALYALTSPGSGALFLEKAFKVRIAVLDVPLTALILTGGSRAIHDALEGISGRGAQKSRAAGA